MNPDKYSQIVQKITAHIQRTLSYCSGVSQEQFMADRMLQEACIFNILQVGELAARVIEYGLDKGHPEIAWRPMRGMRNRIVHDYDGVRLDTVWDTIQKDLPDLLKKLQA